MPEATVLNCIELTLILSRQHMDVLLATSLVETHVKLDDKGIKCCTRQTNAALLHAAQQEIALVMHP